MSRPYYPPLDTGRAPSAQPAAGITSPTSALLGIGWRGAGLENGSVQLRRTLNFDEGTITARAFFGTLSSSTRSTNTSCCAPRRGPMQIRSLLTRELPST
jgi:hypothetical protein